MASGSGGTSLHAVGLAGVSWARREVGGRCGLCLTAAHLLRWRASHGCCGPWGWAVGRKVPEEVRPHTHHMPVSTHTYTHAHIHNTHMPVSTHVYTHAHTIHACVYIHVCIHTRLCLRTSVHDAHTHVSLYTYMHKPISTHVYTHIYTCTRIHAHAYICVHLYLNMHDS